MYTIYNTGDVIFWKPDGSVASVWTSDGLYVTDSGIGTTNFLTKAIVQITRLGVIALSKILKA